MKAADDPDAEMVYAHGSSEGDEVSEIAASELEAAASELRRWSMHHESWPWAFDAADWLDERANGVRQKPDSIIDL